MLRKFFFTLVWQRTKNAVAGCFEKAQEREASTSFHHNWREETLRRKPFRVQEFAIEEVPAIFVEFRSWKRKACNGLFKSLELYPFQFSFVAKSEKRKLLKSPKLLVAEGNFLRMHSTKCSFQVFVELRLDQVFKKRIAYFLDYMKT